jgi:hypothetical protein
MKLYLLALCVWLFVFLPTFNHAIGATDDLDHVVFEGAVTDIGGGAIPGAHVIIRRTADNHERSTKTNPEGRYRFTGLLPGIYELSIVSGGFQSVRYLGISAMAGATVRRDARLHPAAVEAQMTIDATADSLLVDTSRTVVGGTITKQQIDTLPTDARNPFDLIFTLPGAGPAALSDRELAEGERQDNYRKTPEEVGVFALSGGAPFSNNLTIEGVDNNDDRAARERLTPAIGAVEEVQVITNQFSAEYGRASGGRVNLRLRSGSNRIHGQTFFHFRDESLNANPFMRNSDPTRGARLPYQNLNPGASIGGPIKHDRVFFFGAYEYDYLYDQVEIAALLPVESNPAFILPQPNGANLGSASSDKNGKPLVINGGASVGLYDRQITTPRFSHTLQAKTDFNLNARHNLFAFFTFTQNRDERGFPGGRRTLDTLRRTGRDSRSIALSDNYLVSSRIVNSSRFQFSRLTPTDAPAGDSPVVLIDIDDPRDVAGDANANPLTRRGQLTTGASTISGVDRREVRYQMQDTLNVAQGPHSLRAGVDAQIIRSHFTDLTDTTGTFTFANPAEFLNLRPSRYEHRFYTGSELRNTYTGFFMQDDWRARQNLTISLGLRWDNETILADRDNLGPRLAFAWDPFKTGRTVVRAGYGIFFNRALLRTLDDFILTSNTMRIDTNHEAASRLLTELQFPRTLQASDPRIAQLGVRETGFVRRLSKDFRIPESYQASLGCEREIRRDAKIEVNYVFNRGLHLWRESNVNAPRLPAGYHDFSEYLISRDFDNRRDPVTGRRPITSTGAADVARFNLSREPSQVIRESQRTIVVFGLNNPSTSNLSGGLKAALAALNSLRPNPGLTQIEELQSRGNSYYHGASFEVQRRFAARGFLRASYTLSKLLDDGVVNTSSPLVVGDFRRERSLSLLDSRHRIAVSGSFQFPAVLGHVNLSGIFHLSSARPFNIGANGNDRNLDDVDNDRPNFTGDLGAINWRRPGASLSQQLTENFSLPAIGATGNLPRNAGRGPGSYTLNLRLARPFHLGEHGKVEIQIEAFNPFNSTVFNFGAEFVDFTPTGLSDFLIPHRTFRPRSMRIGLKMEF